MLKIKLHQLISSLALAIDLAESSLMCENNFMESVSNINYGKHKFINHSKRTSYLSVKLAQKISKDEEFIKEVFIASSLHDIGATSSIMDIHTNANFIFLHSIRGSNLLKKLPLNVDISNYIKYHHENYDGSGPFRLKGDDIPLISQIIRLADMFELLYDDSKLNFIQRNDIIEWIEAKRGILFSADLIDMFMDMQSRDAFWCDVENLGTTPGIMDSLTPNAISYTSLVDLRDISLVFADIIDAKSPFTHQHSSNLSRLALKVADYLGYSEEKKMQYEIAALLHDVGKLAIPNSILNKNGKLNEYEYTIMRCHTYYTRSVLSQVDGFTHVVDWAANHHEKLNGSGYPLGLGGDVLSPEERMMAVLDIYEALTSHRPYKSGMGKKEAFDIIDRIAAKGEICKEAVMLLKEIV